jgi:hypothetical protein
MFFFLSLSLYGSRVLLLDLGRFFRFLILYTVGRTHWAGDQYVVRPLSTHRATQTSIPFELTISVFERAKTVHASHHAATVIC